MNDKEVIKKLLKIAEKQQKIIEKIAQQVMPQKASVDDFNTLLQDVVSRSQKGSKCSVTSAEALSDGSYDLKMTGSLMREDMAAFKKAAADRFTNGDQMKLRIVRDMAM